MSAFFQEEIEYLLGKCKKSNYHVWKSHKWIIQKVLELI